MESKILIIFIVLILAGCTIQNHISPPASIELVPPLVSVPAQPQPSTSNPLPTPPKIKMIDWQSSLLPLVQQMLSIDITNNDAILLVNNMKNDTYGNIQTDRATAELIRLIVDSGSKFQVVDTNQLNTARKILGLSADDSLESRSKAIGLARYLNAQYVLYSSAIGDTKQPTLDLQLMLVQTGEIIWSGNGLAQD